MRVLYVVNGLGTGGAERSLAELLPHFARAGIEPVIACLHRRTEGVEAQVRAQGFDLRFLRSTRLPGRVREIRRLIRQERPDIVHTAIFESDVAGRLAAAGLGVPVVGSLVNTSYAPARLADPNVRRLRLLAVKAIDGWTARRLGTHFHALTRAVEEAAVRDLGIDPARVSVVERGRDPGRLGSPDPDRRRRVRELLGLSEDDEVLLNVGRQEYQKAQGHLLQAVALLARERPRLVLLVAGRRGNASLDLERLHRETGLGERVRFLGHREDVPDLLAAADLFVFPSLYEGFGGALVEAMALGLPIVASAIDVLREVVEEGRNALLVPPASPRDLAAAVASLLDDPARMRAFGGCSREIFEERFTLARSAARMVEMYRRVASAGAANRQAAEVTAR